VDWIDWEEAENKNASTGPAATINPRIVELMNSVLYVRCLSFLFNRKARSFEDLLPVSYLI